MSQESHFHSFPALQQRIQNLYAEGEYAAALELVRAAAPAFSQYSPHLLYWQIVLLARLHQVQEVLTLIRQQLEAGFWFNDVLLRQNSSLKPLLDLEAFEDLLDWNRNLQERDPERAFPVLLLHSQGKCAAGGPGCPLLIGLHPSGRTATAALDFWRPAAMAGWLVGAVRSSQALWKDAYVWEDHDLAQQEVERHYHALIEQYAVDSQAVVLAGQAEGGELAVQLALRSKIPAVGFLAVAPRGGWFKRTSEWEPLLEGDLRSDLRGLLLVGDADSHVPRQGVQRLAEMLTARGIQCRVETVPEGGPDYSPAYDRPLLRGLSFLTRGESASA